MRDPAQLVTFLRQRFEPAEPLRQLRPYPGNPKDHDQGAISESVDALGFFGAILAQEGTRYVLAGHGRLADLRRRGVATGPVLWVECSSAEAGAIVLADNRVSERGGWNDQALAVFLAVRARDHGLEGLTGTGFDVEDVQRLADTMQPVEWGAGVPLRVHLGDPAKSCVVRRAIEILLERHPEWKARLEAA